MKISIVIFIAFLLSLSHADISYSYTNGNEQTFAMDLTAPTADPATNVIRIDLTYTTPYQFNLAFESIVAICTVTQDGGVFPPDVVSDVFVVVMY